MFAPAKPYLLKCVAAARSNELRADVVPAAGRPELRLLGCRFPTHPTVSLSAVIRPGKNSSQL